MLLSLVKYTVKRFQRKANWRNILSVRRGFERLIKRWERRSTRCSYQPLQIEGIGAEWITPLQYPATNKVLLYLHGGGYATGSINTHRGHISQIVARTNIKALLIDYRLAPEHPYPAALHDATKVYQWLLGQGYLPSHIAFGGDSAGGGLTIGTMLYLRDNHIPLPQCAICLSPWLDLTCSGESMTTKAKEEPMLIAEAMPFWAGEYLGNTDPKTPYASPIYADLRGLPPTYIQVGTAEVLLDDSTRYAARAQEHAAPVTLDIYPDYFHVFQSFFRILPKARQANRKLAQYLMEQL